MKTINFAVSEHNSRVYSLIFLGDNMKFKKYATKTLMIVIGSIISAYGITLAIGAGFGGATLAILWQGLTNVTGMSIGTSSLIVAVAMIIFALFYDRKQINIGTILSERGFTPPLISAGAHMKQSHFRLPKKTGGKSKSYEWFLIL